LGSDGSVVSDDKEGGALAMDLAEEFEDFCSRAAVQGAGGLVGEDNRRLADEGTGNRDALALAA